MNEERRQPQQGDVDDLIFRREEPVAVSQR